MINGLCPDYLSPLVPHTVGKIQYITPIMHPITNIYVENTQLYYNSFLPSVVRDGNELLNITRNATSYSAFKHILMLP